jgi:hypothetical protein
LGLVGKPVGKSCWANTLHPAIGLPGQNDPLSLPVWCLLWTCRQKASSLASMTGVKGLPSVSTARKGSASGPPLRSFFQILQGPADDGFRHPARHAAEGPDGHDPGNLSPSARAEPTVRMASPVSLGDRRAAAAFLIRALHIHRVASQKPGGGK